MKWPSPQVTSLSECSFGVFYCQHDLDLDISCSSDVCVCESVQGMHFYKHFHKFSAHKVWSNGLAFQGPV